MMDPAGLASDFRHPDVLELRKVVPLPVVLQSSEEVLDFTLRIFHRLRQMFVVVGQVEPDVLVGEVGVDEPDQLLLGMKIVELLLSLARWLPARSPGPLLLEYWVHKALYVLPAPV